MPSISNRRRNRIISNLIEEMEQASNEEMKQSVARRADRLIRTFGAERLQSEFSE